MKPVLPSRTARSEASHDGSFSITNCLRDAPSWAGTLGAFCGISAIDPGSGPRNRSLKTTMGKNELAATANCNVTGLATREMFPFNPFRSRSIVTLPLSTIIFSRFPIPPSSRLRWAGWPSRVFCLTCALTAVSLAEAASSRITGSAKLISVFFSIFVLRCELMS